MLKTYLSREMDGLTLADALQHLQATYGKSGSFRRMSRGEEDQQLLRERELPQIAGVFSPRSGMEKVSLEIEGNPGDVDQERIRAVVDGLLPTLLPEYDVPGFGISVSTHRQAASAVQQVGAGWRAPARSYFLDFMLLQPRGRLLNQDQRHSGVQAFLAETGLRNVIHACLQDGRLKLKAADGLQVEPSRTGRPYYRIVGFAEASTPQQFLDKWTADHYGEVDQFRFHASPSSWSVYEHIRRECSALTGEWMVTFNGSPKYDPWLDRMEIISQLGEGRRLPLAVWYVIDSDDEEHYICVKAEVGSSNYRLVVVSNMPDEERLVKTIQQPTGLENIEKEGSD